MSTYDDANRIDRRRIITVVSIQQRLRHHRGVNDTRSGHAWSVVVHRACQRRADQYVRYTTIFPRRTLVRAGTGEETFVDTTPPPGGRLMAF